MKTNKNDKKNYYAWYIVFVNAFMGCTIAASFPQFSLTLQELTQVSGISEQILLASDTVKSVGIVASMLVAGFVYKMAGARCAFILGLACTALPQFFIPYVTSIPVLMAAKFIQGFASLVFPVFLLIIMEWIDDDSTGTATAIFNGIFYGGGGIGGTIAGYVIASHGWIASYNVIGALQVGFGVLWLVTVREKPKQEGNTDIECSAAKGLSVQRLLKMPQVWLLCLAFFSTTFVLQAITVDMPVFGSALGYDQVMTGQIMTAVSIGMIVSCLVSGKISDVAAIRMKDKAKARIMILTIGPALIVLSSALLIVLPLQHFIVFYSAVLIFSFGAAWGLGTFYAILPEMFDEDTLPVITGFAGGIGDIGMPLAPFVVGVVFGVNGLWNLGWASCAAVGIISIGACFALLRERRGASAKL